MTVIIDLASIVEYRAVVVGKLKPYIFWKYWPERLDVSLQNFKYGTVTATTKPRLLSSLDVSNGSSVQQSQNISDSKKTAATFRVSVSKGIKTGKQQTFRFQIPKVGELGGSVTMETTLTETFEQVKQADQTWTWSFTVPVPAKTRLRVDILIEEALYQPNFDAIVQVRGEAGMRYKVTVNGQPTEKFWYCPIGTLFRQMPHADITVVDDYTITFLGAGILEGIEGMKYTVVTTEQPYPGPRREESWPDDALIAYELRVRICTTCSGSGRCQNCGGQGTERCSTCNGQGKLTERCMPCGGTGVVGEGVCLECSGTGEVGRTCPTCSGAGNFECGQCRGSGACKDCSGTGQLSDRFTT